MRASSAAREDADVAAERVAGGRDARGIDGERGLRDGPVDDLVDIVGLGLVIAVEEALVRVVGEHDDEAPRREVVRERGVLRARELEAGRDHDERVGRRAAGRLVDIGGHDVAAGRGDRDGLHRDGERAIVGGVDRAAAATAAAGVVRERAVGRAGSIDRAWGIGGARRIGGAAGSGGRAAARDHGSDGGDGGDGGEREQARHAADSTSFRVAERRSAAATTRP